jgi:phage terminase large subunit GpA-like protein
MAEFDILGEIRRRALACLIPPERKPLSQSIEDSVVLPEGLCACPGKMRLYSYQREIADAIGDPDIERVTLVNAARIGFSVLVAAAIGHFCSNDPSPVICLLPVESDCRDFVASDLEPIFLRQARRWPESCARSRESASGARAGQPCSRASFRAGAFAL